MHLSDPGPAVILVVGWLLIAVAGTIIIARLFVRLKIENRKWAWSDILMCCSWVWAVVATSFNVKFMKLGALDAGVLLSLQNYRGEQDDITMLFKYFWFWSVAFLAAIYLAKGTLLASYSQIFPSFMVKRRTTLWATAIFIALAYLASTLTLIMICLPVHTHWDLDPTSKCPSTKAVTIFHVSWALHVAGDAFLFLLPWLVITKLELKTSVKIAAYCTLFLGLLIVGLAVLPFVAIETAPNQNQVSISLLALLATLDCNLTLIIACLPSLRSYFNLRITEVPTQLKVQVVGSVSTDENEKHPNFTSITWGHRRVTSSISLESDANLKGHRRRISSVFNESGHNPRGYPRPTNSVSIEAGNNNYWGYRRDNESISVESDKDAKDDNDKIGEKGEEVEEN